MSKSISSAQLKTMLKRLADRAETSSVEKQERGIRSLTRAYSNGNLVLVLGAGVSVDFGLLDWKTLLQKLLLASIVQMTQEDEERSDVLAKLFDSLFSPNPLIAARHLHNFYKSQSPQDALAFNKAVRTALYSGLKEPTTSNLLQEIRQLCIAAGKSPNLRCIITYNYDDILEKDLENSGVEVRFKPIHSAGAHADSQELAIYHVHGFLPRSGELSTENRIVLSEGLYHEQYTDVYGWSNLIQINTFKDSNCLFIGSSFSDPNQRRLLEIAKTLRGDDQIHHFCFRRRYEFSKIEIALKNMLKTNPLVFSEKQRANLTLDDTVKDLVDIMENFEEQDAQSFGIGTLWVKEYSEIPKILQRIRRMGRD